MTFDLDQQINKNFRQILKNYLSVDSLEDYDIKIEELRPQNKSYQLFKICFNLTYQLLLLKNNLLAIAATTRYKKIEHLLVVHFLRVKGILVDLGVKVVIIS